jgi:uncharacterized protein YbjQ (UPF0145 family)
VTFGSTFSIAEFAFAREARLQPVAAVHGCDVSVLWHQLPVAGPGSAFGYRQRPVSVAPVPEIDAWFQGARSKVLAQICEQAAHAGADAVIDVQPLPPVIETSFEGLSKSLSGFPMMRRIIELQAVGTAVRGVGARSGVPRLSTLSAGDLWKLGRRGWIPAGIATASSFQFGTGALWAGSVAREVHGATAIWSAARRAAFDCLRTEARGLGAEGLVDVDMQVEHHHLEWEQSGLQYAGMLVGVNIVASAIARLGDAPAPTPVTTILTI